MPELRLLPLEEVLNGGELDNLMSQLAELGAPELPDGDDVIDLEDAVSEEQLTDFLDRLDAHEIACDVYLPVEFEGTFEVGAQSFGSAYTLAEALEEIRDELNIDAGEEDDDTDPDNDPGHELVIMEQQLSYTWHVFARAVSACVSRSIPLHVIT